jgi:uncharacterized phage infection (PIP) family protein YhgE
MLDASLIIRSFDPMSFLLRNNSIMASAEGANEERSEDISSEPKQGRNENILIQRRYGVRSTHADEDTLPAFAQTSFFQKGREFESAYVNHKFTEEEKHQLATYDSLDYFPPHSVVYKVEGVRLSQN